MRNTKTQFAAVTIALTLCTISGLRTAAQEEDLIECDGEGACVDQFAGEEAVQQAWDSGISYKVDSDGSVGGHACTIMTIYSVDTQPALATRCLSNASPLTVWYFLLALLADIAGNTGYVSDSTEGEGGSAIAEPSRSAITFELLPDGPVCSDSTPNFAGHASTQYWCRNLEIIDGISDGGAAPYFRLNPLDPAAGTIEQSGWVVAAGVFTSETGWFGLSFPAPVQSVSFRVRSASSTIQDEITANPGTTISFVAESGTLNPEGAYFGVAGRSALHYSKIFTVSGGVSLVTIQINSAVVSVDNVESTS